MFKYEKAAALQREIYKSKNKMHQDAILRGKKTVI